MFQTIGGVVFETDRICFCVSRLEESFRKMRIRQGIYAKDGRMTLQAQSVFFPPSYVGDPKFGLDNQQLINPLKKLRAIPLQYRFYL
jgi:hypothetical protein